MSRMIRRLGGLLLLGLVALAAPSARAHYVTGLALLEWCQDDARSFCPGYMAGIVDYQAALQRIDAEGPRFCLPVNVRLAELRPVVMGWLRARSPEAQRGSAAPLLLAALGEAFPARDGDCLQRPASYATGYELIDWCRDEAANGFCPGYVAALADYQDELRRINSDGPRFCLPDSLRLGELDQVALERLRVNPPAELRKLAASLVVPGLARRFPCR